MPTAGGDQPAAYAFAQYLFYSLVKALKVEARMVHLARQERPAAALVPKPSNNNWYSQARVMVIKVVVRVWVISRAIRVCV